MRPKVCKNCRLMAPPYRTSRIASDMKHAQTDKKTKADAESALVITLTTNVPPLEA